MLCVQEEPEPWFDLRVVAYGCARGDLDRRKACAYHGSALKVRVRSSHLDGTDPTRLHARRSADAQFGRPRCGSSSSMRLSSCVGRRVRTSRRYAHGSCPLNLADRTRVTTTAAR